MRGSVVQKPARRVAGTWSSSSIGTLGPEHAGGSGTPDSPRSAMLSAAWRGCSRTAGNGSYVAPRNLTLGVYMTEYWLPAIESTVRPTTFNGYRSHVEIYVLPRLGAAAEPDS